MHRPVSCVFAAAVLAMAAGCVAAQNNPVAERTPRPQQPYTAEFKITRVQTLANGTTITKESTEIDARDSAARTLRSTTEQTPSGSRTSWTLADVNDPANKHTCQLEYGKPHGAGDPTATAGPAQRVLGE